MAGHHILRYVGRPYVENQESYGECEDANLRRCSRRNLAAVYWEGIMNLAILPLAITMMAAPQIMSAIVFVTSTRPVRTSAALLFIVATVLVAALPLLPYLLFYRRAQRLAPKVRDWMNAHSWLVNIIVCGVFIPLIL
jgi:small neutral amino acid transporter SnatA (MarC family)